MIDEIRKSKTYIYNLTVVHDKVETHMTAMLYKLTIVRSTKYHNN